MHWLFMLLSLKISYFLYAQCTDSQFIEYNRQIDSKEKKMDSKHAWRPSPSTSNYKLKTENFVSCIFINQNWHSGLQLRLSVAISIVPHTMAYVSSCSQQNMYYERQRIHTIYVYCICIYVCSLFSVQCHSMDQIKIAYIRKVRECEWIAENVYVSWVLRWPMRIKEMVRWNVHKKTIRTETNVYVYGAAF